MEPITKQQYYEAIVNRSKLYHRTMSEGCKLSQEFAQWQSIIDQFENQSKPKTKLLIVHFYEWDLSGGCKQSLVVEAVSRISALDMVKIFHQEWMEKYNEYSFKDYTTQEITLTGTQEIK